MSKVYFWKQENKKTMIKFLLGIFALNSILFAESVAKRNIPPHIIAESAVNKSNKSTIIVKNSRADEISISPRSRPKCICIKGKYSSIIKSSKKKYCPLHRDSQLNLRPTVILGEK